MSKGYAHQLSALSAAIIERDSSAVLPLINNAREDKVTQQQRIAVYADGYAERLMKVIAVDYPCTRHYLGEQVFSALAEDFIRENPSRHWDLNFYSIHFAYAAKIHSPEAKALAQLEAAITECFWAAESAALSAEALNMQMLEHHRFALRGACKLLHLSFQANAYLSAFRSGEPLAGMAAENEYLIIVRHNNTVQRHTFSKMHFDLLQAALSMPFAQALEAATDAETLLLTLPDTIASWLQQGIFKA